MPVTIDFETKSYADLGETGAWAYSEDPSTEIICMAYGIDNQPIQDWWPGKHDSNRCPEDLYMMIMLGDEVEAHNVSFEYAIWRNIMVKRYGWVEILDHQWRDTMAVAAYYALPHDLDKLANVLGYEGKDPEGGRLITRYSKLYLKTAKKVIPPEDFQKFVNYCRKDVAIEQSVSDFLGDLPERELPIFQLDLRANARGLKLDKAGIAAAADVIEQVAVELKAEFRELTGLNPTQLPKVKAWLEQNGVDLPDMTADTLEAALSEEGRVPQGPARRAMKIRLELNKASTTKLDKMISQLGSDGRARFQTRYHGTNTGRNTGAGFQPLNLVRSWEKMDPGQLVRDIMYRDPTWLRCLYGSPTEAVSRALRYFIQPEKGKRIMALDYVSIEAVVLACAAGEEWKVDAFRNKVKIYEAMADKIYGLPPGTVTKETHPYERQDGKTCLGASTQVLTDDGWKDIVDVTVNDRVWDGIEWVSHGGVVFQGVKPTFEMMGVEITLDHQVLVREGVWVEAAFAAPYLNQILGIGMDLLPFAGSSAALSEASWGCGYHATAGSENISSPRVTCETGRREAARNALSVKPPNGARTSSGSPTFAPMMPIVGGCLTASLHALLAAGRVGTETMARAAFASGRSGLRGLQENVNICLTSWVSKVGINLSWRSTASTSIEATNQGTFDLPSAAKERSAKSGSFNPGLLSLRPVFDIANAGPRKRFMIRTVAGPILVHNCELAFGYQGALNAWLKFDDSGRHSDERIIEICKAWRAEHPMIKQMWYGMEDAAIECVATGRETSYRDFGFDMVDDWLAMVLPDGKCIWYWKPELRTKMPRWHDPEQNDDCADGTCDCRPKPALTYMTKKGKSWFRTHTYGGKLTENAIQATARQILWPAAQAVETAGYHVILTVYDEIVAEVPDGFGSLKEFEEIALGALPEFARDWPIRVDGWEGNRYKK